MKKRVKMLGALMGMVPMAMAQQVTEQETDSVQNAFRDDNATFIFSEDQLGEDDDNARVASVVSSQSDPYMSEVGYLFSPMRFKYRAYDSQYNRNFMNGMLMNNVESGRFSFSGMTGGLNDATRNKEGVGFYDHNNFGYSNVGGATNINLRAGQYAAGSKVGLAATNRNYILRGTYTYATGVLANGWSFMGSLAYRWANQGVIEGTFYNALSYMLGAEKYINDKHHLSFVTWGAPTERGQQGAATEEAYWLANSHYYNPYWGYQNGQKRNSRVVTEYSPSAMLTWDFKADDKTKLTTNASFTYSMYASTALSYNNSYNPMPTYYKNLPSSIFNVYDPSFNNGNYLNSHEGILDAYNSLYDYWTACKANRQVQWDRIIAQNQAANAEGRDALVYQEKRHNDQMVWRLNSVFDKLLNANNRYTLGVSLNHTKGMHYKTMADLLGSTHFTDIDSYSLSRYGDNSSEIQNDLDNPNRSISVGDRFGYDYDIFVNKAQAWGQYSVTAGDFDAVLGADIEGTTIERNGHMRNGRAPEYSKGSSGTAKFLGGGGKLQLGYRLFGTSKLTLSASYESQAPLANNVFVAPRISNNFANNLENERIFNAEAAYQFHFGILSGKVSAYYTRMNDLTYQTAFYNDDAGYLTYLTMTDMNKSYKGLEAAVTLKLTNNLKLNLLGTISDAKFVNNPSAQLAYEGTNASTMNEMNQWINPVNGENMPLKVILDGTREGSTPLTAASVGLDYNINGWYFSVNLNYYGRVYISPSFYTRLGSIMDDSDNNGQYYTYDQSKINTITGFISNAYEEAAQAGGNVYDAQSGELLASYTKQQERCKGGFMLDASIGKSIRLSGGKRLSINLQMVNLTNNRNLCTGGYEQSRNDRVYDYIFSKNSYRFYANAINAFLNVGLRF